MTYLYFLECSILLPSSELPRSLALSMPLIHGNMLLVQRSVFGMIKMGRGSSPCCCLGCNREIPCSSMVIPSATKIH